MKSFVKKEDVPKEKYKDASEINNYTEERGLVEHEHNNLKSCGDLRMDLSADEIQKEGNHASKKSANASSFLKWLPFPFGSPHSSKPSHVTSNQDSEVFQDTIKIADHCSPPNFNNRQERNQKMIVPSPEQQWMVSSEIQPEMADIMRNVLSDALEDTSTVPYGKTWAHGTTHSLLSPNSKDAQSSTSQTKAGDQGTISVANKSKCKRTNKKHRSSSRQTMDESLLFSRGSAGRNNVSSRTSWTSRLRSSSPPPKVVNINGKKVTIVDWTLKVLVFDLLSPETCALVRTMADDHVRKIHENGNRVPTWRTLYTYTKQDLPCSEVENLSTLVTDSITASVKSVVGEIFGKPKEASQLRERSWKEPHLLLYQNIEGKPVHTGVEMHYDGCDITWICMLSSIDEYTGGGTYIRALRKNIKLQQGQVLVFPGELYHKGCDIRSGVRAMAVCFLDGFETHVTDPSSPNTDRAEWQDNTRIY